MTWIVRGGQQLELETRGRAGGLRAGGVRRAAGGVRRAGAGRPARQSVPAPAPRRCRASAPSAREPMRRVLCRRPGAALHVPRARRALPRTPTVLATP